MISTAVIRSANASQAWLAVLDLVMSAHARQTGPLILELEAPEGAPAEDPAAREEDPRATQRRPREAGAGAHGAL